MNNLSVHHSQEVTVLTEAVGAEVKFLPPLLARSQPD